MTDRRQATTTSENTQTTHLSSSVFTDGSTTRHSQPITPRSTVSATSPTEDSHHRQDPTPKLLASKPRASDPTPVKAGAATPLSVPTQLKSALPLVWRHLLPEAGFVPVTIPPTFNRFLYLPIEIRKHIYVYLVHNGVHGLLIPKDMRAYHQAPITRVTQRIPSTPRIVNSPSLVPRSHATSETPD
jgi:hypothetical protein